MKKILLLLGIITLLLVSSVSAVWITDEQFMSYTNQQIANYMQNNLFATGYEFTFDGVNVYWSLPYVYQGVNPNTEVLGWNLDTIQLTTYNSFGTWGFCLTNYPNSCASVLLWSEEEVCVNGVQVISCEDGDENTTIYQPYQYQALTLGINYYYEVLEMRDNLIAQYDLENSISEALDQEI